MGKQKTNIRIGNIAKDSFILIFVQCVTLCCGIIQTMILSRILTKYEYGTYSQGMLVISLATTLVGFGANNAVNYFYNKTENVKEKNLYLNTMFFLELAIGFLGAVVIIFLGGPIANYFKNPQLSVLVLSFALRPLFANIILMYQTLYISSKMAKAIAVRNLLVSLAEVLITSAVSFFTHDIFIIFFLLSFLDIAQIVIFGSYFRKKIFAIRPFRFSRKMIKPIISYAVPMALALMVGTLLTNMDSLFIGKMMATEDLAVYANMSKELPFYFIGSTFTTVVTPAVIKLLNSGRREEFCRIWSGYVQLGYMTTWPLCFGAVACAPELLRFLYSSRYISGLNVFLIYIVIGMFRFTYCGLILTATGKTKTILLYSSLTLVLNFTLNIILFRFLGMIGCALATLVSVSVVGFLQLFHSAKIVHIPLHVVLNLKKMVLFLAQMLALTALCVKGKQLIVHFVHNDVLIVVLTYCVFLVLFLILNWKYIRKLVHNLND